MKFTFGKPLGIILIMLLLVNLFTGIVIAGEEELGQLNPPTINGVMDGETYTQPVTITWEDAEGTTSEATLEKDRAEPVPYIKGMKLAEIGQYVLTVTVTETASGLTVSTDVSFIIEAVEEKEEIEEIEEETPTTSEAPVIEGIEDGVVYTEPVAASWGTVEGTITKATLSKDGGKAIPYSKGALITESGAYFLKVGLTDPQTGMSASTSIRFTLSIESPVKDFKSLEAKRIKSLKASLTPNKRKLSTKLLQLVDESFIPPGETKEKVKNQMISNKQIKLAGQTSKGMKKTNDDLVYVYINLQKGADTDIIAPYSYKIKNRDEKNGLAAVWVETAKLEDLASLPGVLQIHPVAPPIVKSGSVITEGYERHRVNELWNNYGQGGAGVKIGVISDGVDNWTQAADTGDLPLDLVVLSNSQGGDEGTAMLEIIHDLAPEAKLYFHDCGDNVLAFNEAIDNLVEAGCDIIVDDIGWVYEPFFEDGVIAQHVSTLTGQVVYISSAGNTGGTQGSAHYQGDYYQLGDTVWHDFSGANPSEYTELYARIPPGGVIWGILQWNDEFGSSANDYDLYLFDVTGENAADPVALDYSLGFQKGAGYDPLEYVYYSNPLSTSIDVILSVAKDTVAQNRTLEMYIYTLGSGTDINDTNIYGDDSIFGHPAVPSVIAVGAINQDTPDQIAAYSSRGPVTMIAGPARPKPDIAGIDGVSVTGAGSFPSTFYGTSAAAPHIAAIAGLIKGYFPDKTPAEIRSMIYETAIDLGPVVGPDLTYGNGRADAFNVFDTHDNRAPGLNGFEVTDLNSSIILNFDENIYYSGEASTLKDRITVTDSVYTESITSASILGRQLRIDLEGLLTGENNKIVVDAGTLKDKKGEAIPDELTVEGIDEDTTPPVKNGDFVGYKKVFVLFNEKIQDNTAHPKDLKSSVRCVANDVYEVDINDNQLILSFATPLVGPNDVINIDANTIRDTNGNIVDSPIAINLDIGPSNEARLSALTLSNASLSQTFNMDESTYTASVSSSVSSITVTPTCLHSGATVTVNGSTVSSGQASGPISLSYGNNSIAIQVTAEDAQTKKTYNITVTREYSSGGGGGGGSYTPTPTQPLRPLPPVAILSNTVTDDDKALEKSLQETGVALLDLSGNSDGMASFSPGILTQLSAKNKPLLIENNGIKLQFYSNSLITQEIRNSLTKPGAVVNIGARPLDEQERLRIIAQTPQGENTGIYSIGGDVFELTVQVVYVGPDGVPVNQRVEKFITPVAVTINLAALRLNPEAAGQLSGVRLEKDTEGNVIPIPLGGAYNPQNYTFTFHTDKFSSYTVMQFKYRTALNLSIGSTIGYVNGSINTLDAPPTIVNNRAMVPLRFIGEALGASFKWDGTTKTVSFKLGLKEVKLVVGKLAPGLDSPPVIVNDRTMVPVRYISEAFGAKVNWYPSSNMVTVFKD